VMHPTMLVLSGVHVIPFIMYPLSPKTSNSCLLRLSEQRLVLLLGFDECFLEEVGICTYLLARGFGTSQITGLTLAVGETDSQSLGLRLALADVGSGVPDPAAVAANVG
jgi:hypothetical protein